MAALVALIGHRVVDVAQCTHPTQVLSSYSSCVPSAAGALQHGRPAPDAAGPGHRHVPGQQRREPQAAGADPQRPEAPGGG